MITRIGLKNFKLHSETTIDATTLTVFIGPNNSGKSSVFQSLLLWRQGTAPGQAQLCKKIQSQGRRPRVLEPVAFINQLLKNSQKWSVESGECPKLPENAVVPAEDTEIVRLAFLAKVRIITGDADLRTTVNSCPALGIEALSPAEALPYAADN